MPKTAFWRRVTLGLLILLLVSIFSSRRVLAVTTTISNFPTEIGSDPFSVTVNINQAANATNYLRIDLYKEETTQYFGETFNGRDWYRGSTGQSYFPVEIIEGTASASLQVRVGSPSLSEYDGPGTYRLRARRYTVSGNYTAAEANGSSITVQISVPLPTSTPTPTNTVTPVTPTATVAVYPSGVYLSEFLPDPPSGEKEWVEIFNSNSAEVDLVDWLIDDQEGASSYEKFQIKLAPLSYGQLFLGSNKLNNGGDTVRLLYPDRRLVDSYSYSSSHDGAAWAKDDGGAWRETSKLSPGAANVFVPVGGFPHREKISELKKLTLGSTIELMAVVSVPLSLFSEKEFYVVDESNGIKIVIEEIPAVSMKLGDIVHVASTIEESHQEKYIKSTTYEIQKTDQPFPDPIEISTGNLTEANEGRLAKIIGQYQASDGDNFYIDDGSGRAKIYLKESTGILKLKMDKGDQIEAQGVVSQYDYLKGGTPNYRLLLRFQSDLRNLSEEERLRGSVLGTATQLPVTGGASFSWPLASLSLGLLIKAVLKFRCEVP